MALDENGRHVQAQDALRSERYSCPVCNARVTLKQGTVKTAHFSHHHIIDCMRYLYKRESIEHLELKHELYLALTPRHHTAMEYYLPEVEQIADILVNKNLALEIQLSVISPQLIVERTAGYASIGIKVIWLLDGTALKQDRNYIYPTHFQLSTQTDHKIHTIDLKTHEINVFHIRHHMGCNRFTYERRPVSPAGLLEGCPTPIDHNAKLSAGDLKRIIARERSRRDIRNLTLTLLYHSGLTAETIPEYLTFSTPTDRYLMNSPLEWKLFIHHHINLGTFSIALFKEVLKTRQMYGVPDKNTLARLLLKEYLMLYNSHKRSELEIY